ncbi:hypothetical protein FALBO_7832 [Fusarium albosuccineum]|uniref:Uncharacterized protein n=1 Tax=Fusarium albosuccineum TaxID=1237068 RepID=A0A8H4LBR9_9HYPO|nr:hypothetical protein FALBO_7832 [Fusarium albosuccineum]
MAPASAPVPTITVTAPNGEQRPVAVFCLPAREEELVPAWELFPLDESSPVAPGPGPGPAAAAANSLLLSDEGMLTLGSCSSSSSARTRPVRGYSVQFAVHMSIQPSMYTVYFTGTSRPCPHLNPRPSHDSQVHPAPDIDNMSFDELWERVKQGHDDIANQKQQEKDDYSYAKLPDIVSDYKTLRVPARDYVENQCRLCKTVFSCQKSVRAHLGVEILLRAEAEEEEDEDEEDEDEDEEIALVEPPRKKQKTEKNVFIDGIGTLLNDEMDLHQLIPLQLESILSSEECAKLMYDDTHSTLSGTYWTIIQLLRTASDWIEESITNLRELVDIMERTFFSTSLPIDTITLISPSEHFQKAAAAAFRQDWEFILTKYRKNGKTLLQRISQKKEVVENLREGLFNATAIQEAAKSKTLNHYIIVFTIVTIFYLPLSFVAVCPLRIRIVQMGQI